MLETNDHRESVILKHNRRFAGTRNPSEECLTSSPMQYRLRTLLILLAVGPPVLAGTWFRYLDHHERQRLAADRELELVLTQLLYDTKTRTAIQFSGSLLHDLPDEAREQ